MNSERAREAAEYRAKGNEESQTIKAKADRDVVVLLGNAQQTADQTRGEGEAERNKIFAEAYGKDPDFFAFYRLMNAYGEALQGPNTRLVLSAGATAQRVLPLLQVAERTVPAAVARPRSRPRCHQDSSSAAAVTIPHQGPTRIIEAPSSEPSRSPPCRRSGLSARQSGAGDGLKRISMLWHYGLLAKSIDRDG